MGWYLRLDYMLNLDLHFFFLDGVSFPPNVLVGACMSPMLWVLIQFDIRLRSNALSRRIRSVSMVSGSESIGIATVCTNVEFFIWCNAVISVMCGSSNSVETNASRRWELKHTETHCNNYNTLKHTVTYRNTLQHTYNKLLQTTYIYIYIYICVYICIPKHVNVTYIQMYTYIYIYVHVYLHTHYMYILHIYMCVVVCTFGLACGGTSDKTCTTAPGGANVLVSTVHDVFVCACVWVCVCVRA